MITNNRRAGNDIPGDSESDNMDTAINPHHKGYDIEVIPRDRLLPLTQIAGLSQQTRHGHLQQAHEIFRRDFSPLHAQPYNQQPLLFGRTRSNRASYLRRKKLAKCIQLRVTTTQDRCGCKVR